jgi:hypothetical protein
MVTNKISQARMNDPQIFLLKKTVILELISYFAAGCTVDFISTMTVIFIAKNIIIAAVTSSFILALVPIIVAVKIAGKKENKIIFSVVYAFGAALGTLIGMIVGFNFIV